MRRPGIVLFMHLALVGGCVTEARIARIEAEKRAAAEAELQPGSALSATDLDAIRSEAEEAAEIEARDERGEIIGRGAGTAGAFSTGNIVAGVLSAIGLAGVAFGSYRKMKGAA